MKNNIEVRRPAVAGSFYPGNPVELSKLLAQFYSETEKKSLPGHPLAVIAPHAGYIYSGKIAAAAFKQLEGETYDTVVVISPSHTVFFQGSSVYEGSAYQTPIGMIEIDEKLSGAIASIHPSIYLSNKGHTGGSVRGEHALEVQLPFLQQVLGRFKLVAIVMGDQEESSCRDLGETLASTLNGKSVLIVASTDLSHFYSDKEARRLDGNLRRAIEEFSPDKLLNTLSSGKGEACGGGPVAATLIAAKRLGANQVTVTGYATSGDVTGDLNEVVGYLSAVITSTRKVASQNGNLGSPAKKNGAEIGDADKKYLLNLARESIRAGLSQTPFRPAEPEVKALKEKRGVFVTLKVDGMLRGCIGMIRAAKPLYEAVAEMAHAAAFDDPRFQPLSETELDGIEVEISVLSPLSRVEDFSEIRVGRDGLMIRLDFHSGLLLPQVAREHGWNLTTFLEQTCLKAGLPKNSYKDKAAEIYRFTAEIF